MAENSAPSGQMAWLDLTVEHAEQVRDFYQQVVGWQASNVSMGEYNDFAMMAGDDEQPVAGICHARGDNSDIPPAWMPYFLVNDVEQSLAAVLSGGGQQITKVKSMGDDKFVMIKDPAGAVCALYQKG